MLNDKENEKYNIIEQVINGTLTRKEAMYKLKKPEFATLKFITNLTKTYF